MPDITMCTGVNCPKKETCYRHTAIPNQYRQSYFESPPLELRYLEGAGTRYDCQFYWEDK